MSNQLKCTICGFDIKDDVFVGDGDGTGQHFAHQACYQRRELAEKDERIRELEQFKNAAPQALIELVQQRDESRQELKAAQAEVKHWKSVSKDCSDNYHAMRSEIELAAETSRKLKAANERIRELEQRIARQAVIVHRRQESWHEKEQQLKAAQDGLHSEKMAFDAAMEELNTVKDALKISQEAANYMHRSYHVIVDGECSYCEYFGKEQSGGM